MRSRCRSAEQALALARACRRTRGRGPGAHRARRRPRLPRPRRGGPRPVSAGPAARRRDRRSPWPGARVRQAHRRADDAGTAPGVGATGGRRGSRRCSATGSTAPCSSPNQIEALLAIGEWDEAERLSAAALRAHHRRASPHWLLIIRADVEIGRGELRRRAGAPRGRDAPPCARTACWRPTTRYVAELALWERRWTDADAAVHDGLAQARHPRGCRRSASSSAPRDCAHRRSWQRSHAPAGTPTPSATGSTARESCSPSLAAPPRRPQRSPRTRPAGSPWPRPSTSAPAARLDRRRGRRQQRPGNGSNVPPLAAYCRWRQAEALVAAGASRTEASVPLREAHAVAARIGAKAPAARARTARPARAARSRAAGGGVRPTESRAWRRSSA